MDLENVTDLSDAGSSVVFLSSGDSDVVSLEVSDSMIDDNHEETTTAKDKNEKPAFTEPTKGTSETSSSNWNFDDNLPETVCLFTTEWGSKVYVVGTAHFSLESQEDVARVIQEVKPNYVVVELCKSRSHMLTLEEDAILKEAKSINLQKTMEIIRRNGVMQGVMYLMLLSVSAHITKELGMAPGGEFRRALKEAKKIDNCMILLGDRPINITLNRALASLSLWQKLKLAYHLLSKKEPISKEDVEKCKKRDFLEAMLTEMAGEFPQLKQVLVSERDKYLTYSLKNAALMERTSAGVVPTKVVGVVGIGHLRGIQDHWKTLKNSDIPQILTVPRRSLANKIFWSTFKLGFFCGTAYGIYKVVTRLTATETAFSK